MSSIYDIIIIGGGVVGLGVFRQLILNGYRKVLLLDKSSQIITGASSGNSGILHTGFDTIPQTLESTLVKRGYELYQSFAKDIELPIKKIGAYIIAWETKDLEILQQIFDIAHEVNKSFYHSDKLSTLSTEFNVLVSFFRMVSLISKRYLLLHYTNVNLIYVQMLYVPFISLVNLSLIHLHYL
jgi:L-2-hydroxyglutarate oxidase LhgO